MVLGFKQQFIEGTKTPKPILHLNVKQKWFDMILSGEKKEEYREMKLYWYRVFSHNIKIKGKYYHPSDVIICFSNGYSKNRRQMLCNCTGLSTNYGKEKWGAIPNEQYFVLFLGELELINSLDGEKVLAWLQTDY